MLKKSEPVIVDHATLRAEYYNLALVMSLAEGGMDRESLRLVLKEARDKLDDRSYRALQADIREHILGRRA